MHEVATIAINRCPPDRARQIHAGLALIVTTGFLVVVLFTAPLSLASQIVFVSLSVLILGIPHGAMDHRVGEWVLKEHFSTRWKPVFAVIYCGLTFTMLLIWYLAPVVALVIFLTLSALHFGLGDAKINRRESAAGHQIFIAFTRGTIPIGLPVIFHQKEVWMLFGWLMPQTLGANALPMQGIFWAAVLITIPALTFQLVYSVAKRDGGTLLELALLGFVASILPPLISFAIYFGLWHGPRHLIELAWWRGQQLSGGSNDSTSGAISLVNGFRKIAWEAIPLTLVTWFMMAIAFRMLTKSTSADASTVRVLFISLSALTVPHMLLTSIADDKCMQGH